ncbi:hypothetical protein CRUP_013714 [Coryphaenoides rupestris]|nr:hypothetical protein CRUP_013714 [Coryphaenoides rupestris]
MNLSEIKKRKKKKKKKKKTKTRMKTKRRKEERAAVMVLGNPESSVVDNIKVCSNDLGTGTFKRVCITVRIPRNPTIGDKFASRHGQKGILSRLWPVEDMPFTENGMTPDILFNPHGFPSRMTIGMLIESMAGKSAAMHGLCHDATPFTFSEKHSALEHFGGLLREAGYNHYGTERLYSGLSGLELEADIFIGVVYYQRLRHMVSDKFQVRTTGARDKVTNQPVGGRHLQGGVRFGEMERDALLAHGTSFLLHDRLFNCSDRSEAQVCVPCGSLLSPLLEKPTESTLRHRKTACSLCGRSDAIELINVPYVFRYFVAELAAMNIKVKLNTVARTPASEPPCMSVSRESPTITQRPASVPSSAKQWRKMESAGFCSACSPPTTTASKRSSQRVAAIFSRCVWLSPLVPQQGADLRAEAQRLQATALPDAVALTGQRSGARARRLLVDALLPVVHAHLVDAPPRLGIERLAQQFAFELFIDAADGDVIEARRLPQ